MSDSAARSLLIYAGAMLGLYAVGRWLYRPGLWLLQLAWRCLAGGAVVWAVDWVGASFGLHIALNPVTALVTGVLGLPGLAALVALAV